MSMQEMDYFSQKPDLDMKSFYQGRALKLAGDVQSGVAPPPPDRGWVAQTEESEEDEK